MFSTILWPILLSLSIQEIIAGASTRCKYFDSNFSCHNVELEDMYGTLFYWKDSFPLVTEIEILNSNVSSVDHIYKTPQLDSLRSLKIINSSVKCIAIGAFSDFGYLEVLDLSFNQLNNLDFVNGAPKTLIKLFLNNNNVTHVAVDFSVLPRLNVLDLSFNKIKILELEKVKNVYDINFSYNDLFWVTPCQYHQHQASLNLSSNKISRYNESEIHFHTDSLDLSRNNLSVIYLIFQKEYLSLSGGTVKKFTGDIFVRYADLSYFNARSVKFYAGYELILKNNKIGILTNFAINIRNIYDRFEIHYLDLSNSSIVSISKGYFSKYHLMTLNLSFNNIDVLYSYTFQYSDIKEDLDLSNSKIKQIQPYAFEDVKIKNLNLSYNNITWLEKAFSGSAISHINLSFNPVRYLKNNYFENCSRLASVTLSNCLIEKIEPGTFSNLPLSTLQLEGNKISDLKKGSFSNLNNVVKLNLSDMGIKNVESGAFFNLSKIEEIDLSRNEIDAIRPNVFVNVRNLMSVDLSRNPIKTLNKFSNGLKIKRLSISIDGTFEADAISNFNLEILTVTNSRIDSLKRDSFKGLFGLSELYFNDSKIVSIERGALNDLYSLEILDARNLFRFTKTLSANTFADLRSLRCLNLSNVNLEVLEPYCFRGLNKLESLDLSKNNISSIQNNTFFGLASLKRLDLSHSDIELIKPGAFDNLRNLNALHLQFNRIATIERAFYDLNSVKVLDLSHNRLKKLNSGCFHGFENLLELNLSGDEIEYFDVGVFKFLQNLKVLNLSDNNVGSNYAPRNSIETGTFSNLINLEILDLSFNSFSNLKVKTLLVAMRNLKRLLLDNNGLKSFDFEGLVKNFQHLIYVGISFNSWDCEYLADGLEKLYNRSVNYRPKKPMFDTDNIEGINCNNICKFMYCEGDSLINK